MTSVAQVVRRVIEDLSDGVSDLMLTVIVLSEQNAEFPPELPTSASAVNQTAQMLAKIARQLASTNYKKYPPISSEIVTSADAVDGATGTLTNAVVALQNAQTRRQGWEGLVDACRIMAGYTIRLLQVVYGADWERIIFARDEALSDLDAVNPESLSSDPKNLAAAGSKAATSAAQLANYLKQRAVDAESPLAKAALAEAASALEAQSKSFLDQVNSALQTPDNEASKLALEDEKQKLKDALENAVCIAEKQAPEAPSMPTIAPKGRDYSDWFEENIENTPARHPGEDHDSPFARLIEAARQAVVNAGVKNDSAGVASGSNDLKLILDELTPKIDAHATKTHDKDRKTDIKDTDVGKNYVPLLLAAKNALGRDANNPLDSHKRALAERGGDLINLLNDLESATKQATLYENANELLDALGENKDVNALRQRIKDQGDYCAVVNQNPKQRRAIRAAADDLDSVLASLPPKRTKDQQDLVRALVDALVVASAAEPLSALQAVERSADSLQHAAQRDDAPAIKRESDKEAARAKVLFDSSQRQALGIRDDPVQKQKIIGAAHDVERVGDEHRNTAKQLMNDPSSPELGEDLVVVRGVLDDALKILADALHNRSKLARPDDSLLKDDIDEIQARIDRIPQIIQRAPDALPAHLKGLENLSKSVLARADALVPTADPSKRKLLEDTIAALKQTQQPLESKAKAHRDNLTEVTRKDLATVSSNAKGLWEDLRDLTRPGGLWDSAQALVRAIDSVAEGSRDPQPDAEQQRRVDAMSEAHQNFQNQGKFAAKQKLDASERDNVLAALTALDEVVADIRGDIATKQPQEQTDTDAEEAKQILQDILELLHGAALDNAAVLRAAANALVRAGERGDESLNSGIDSVRDAAKKLIASLGEMVTRLPTSRADAVRALADEIARAAEAEAGCGEKLQAEPSVKNRQALRQARDDLIQLLDELQDALGHRNADLDPMMHQYEDSYDDSEFRYEDDSLSHEDPSDSSVPPPQPLDHSPLSHEIERLRQTAKDLKDKALTKDAKGTLTVAKRANKEEDVVKEKVKALVDSANSRDRQAEIMEAMDRVDDALRAETEAAKELLEKDTPQSRKAVQDENEKVNAALDALLDSTREPDLHENRLAVRAYIASGSPPPLTPISHMMAQQAVYLVHHNSDRAARKEVQALADELVKLATAADNVPSQSTLEAVRAASEALADAVHAEGVSAINRLRRHDAALSKAALQGDVPTLKARSAGLPVKVGSVEAAVKACMSRMPGGQRARVDAALQEVPYAAGNVLAELEVSILTPGPHEDVISATADLDSVLTNVYDALLNSVPMNAKASSTQRHADDLERLIPKLEDANAQQQEKPNDPRPKKAVHQLASRADKAAADLMKSILAADDRAIAAAHHYIRLVDDVEDAALVGDQTKYFQALQALQELDRGRDLDHALEEAAKVHANPAELDTMRKAIKAVRDGVKTLADACRGAITNPGAKESAAQVAAQVRRNVGHATTRAVPNADESVLADTIPKLQAAMSRPLGPTDEAASRARLQRAAERRGLYTPAAPPAATLQDQWRAYTSGAGPQGFRSVLDDTKSTTKCEAISPARALADSFDALVFAVDTGSDARLQPAARDMVRDVNGVADAIEAVKDAKTRNAAANTFDKIQELVNASVEAANKANAAQGDQRLRDIEALVTTGDLLKQELAKLNSQLDPDGRDRPVEVAIWKTRAAAGAVYQAHINKTPTDAAISHTVSAAAEASSFARKVQPTVYAKSKMSQIATAAANLDEQAQYLATCDASNRGLATQKVQQACDELLDVIKASPKDDLSRNHGRAHARLQQIQRNKDELDTPALALVADDAADYLRNIVGSTRDDGTSRRSEKGNTTVPHRDVKVPEAIAAIQKASSREPEQWDPLLRSLNQVANPTPPPSKVATQPTRSVRGKAPAEVPKGGTFEEVAESVAKSIATKVKDVDCAEANEIAKLLAELAAAARSGDRTKLIELSRLIAEKGKAFSQILRRYSNSISGSGIPERDAQTQMTRAAQGMQNYGMQLKILCSVKAAALESNKDNDETLNTLVRDIGAIVTLGLDGMDVARKTILKADV